MIKALNFADDLANADKRMNSVSLCDKVKNIVGKGFINKTFLA